MKKWKLLEDEKITKFNDVLQSQIVSGPRTTKSIRISDCLGTPASNKQSQWHRNPITLGSLNLHASYEAASELASKRVRTASLY